MLGGEAQNKVLNSTEIWFFREKTWRPFVVLPSPRSQHTATILDDGNVIIVGGEDGEKLSDGSPINDV